MASQELEYLAELMAAFRVEGPIFDSVEDAEAKIQLRYQSLLDSLVDSEGVLKRLHSAGEEVFPSLFESLTKLSHRTLFGGILSNAGNYRLPTDPDGGSVHFGTQYAGPPEFTGTPVGKIVGELSGVFWHLSKNATDPVASAVTFYQQFVRVHPFYDANGRICRLLVSVYLDYHQRYVDWDSLQRQGEWLRKLNACHKRQDQPHLYPEYLERLIGYFANHVQLKSDFEFDE